MIRLKELRESRNTSRKQLADHLKIAQNTLSYWESGKYEPDIENILSIANYFNVSTDYLLCNSVFENIPTEFCNNTFKDNLKYLRLRNNITQEKLADALGVRQSTVAMWENGKNKPEFDALTRIADFFNVSVDDLVGKTETKKAPVESDKGNKSAAVLEFQNLVRSISLDQVREVKAFLSLSDEQRRAILALAKIDLDDKE